ncbi:MAG: precorrin-6y C5,15-methyltransferase (decarboxylating) subunit CbiE [Candidatus Chlorobium antarcticum]|jgi:precorrin-6Y C5,15-methyltransferase (decarboxylating)|nr:precorrin-6y C5,15-methyltransferase (decarboxylating) subunit CbiE [Candidatus Chlorobium antarcticum]
MSERLTLIGVTDSRQLQLSKEAREAVAVHRVFCGGERHHRLVKDHLPPGSRWITIAPPMDGVISEIRRENGPVLVFASGDPFFYGIGATLQRAFPEAFFSSMPAFHSLQLLAQRCLLPYQEMHHTSLTGRSWAELDSALIGGERMIGVLTDRNKTPSAIAARMLEYGYGGYSMRVGEALGGPEERIRNCSLEDAETEQFHDLNCVLLQLDVPRRQYFGIPEAEFAGLQGRPNMITKMPFRLAALSCLDLANASSFWDIGFCTGSVSIEARLQFPHLAVTAFEKRRECDELLEVNSRKFGAPGIRKVMDDFLQQDCSGYCGAGGTVDAVFIGGHGGRLAAIFEKVIPFLASGGRIVTNAVQPSSRDEFLRLAAERGCFVRENLTLRADDHNPVEVLTAVHRQGNENQ